ncbi:hypothetical protein NQ318_001754 [Aromia moschata]|uniref:Uncharacterized protein n=1 Tax=Aromia moschata TaxID=1265417 RepID=A0AAV8XSE5_9CUCU|nr:hypothetical protein NQ318_001754 [Aromia moschata]
MVHQQLALKYGLLAMAPASYKSEVAVMYWDRPIITDRTVDLDRLDILLINKEQRRGIIIDIAVSPTIFKRLNGRSLRRTRGEPKCGNETRRSAYGDYVHQWGIGYSKKFRIDPPAVGPIGSQSRLDVESLFFFVVFFNGLIVRISVYNLKQENTHIHQNEVPTAPGIPPLPGHNLRNVHVPQAISELRSVRQAEPSKPPNQESSKSLGDFFHKMHMAATKRCAYLLDESCGNGGIPGAGSDSDWLNQGFNPGKRGLNLFDEGSINGGISGISQDSDFLNTGFNPGKRCVNTMDEACNNGGIPGSGSDSDCNGGIPGSGSDSDWLNPNGLNPGKRRLGDDEGIPGAGQDNDWLHSGDTPGRR